MRTSSKPAPPNIPRPRRAATGTVCGPASTTARRPRPTTTAPRPPKAKATARTCSPRPASPRSSPLQNPSRKREGQRDLPACWLVAAGRASDAGAAPQRAKESKRPSMTDKKKLKLLHLSQPQRACLEGLSNRRTKLPTDPHHDEPGPLGHVTQQAPRMTPPTTGRTGPAAGADP